MTSREPNGRLSRRKKHVNARALAEAAENMSVAVNARVRVYGLSEQQAAWNVIGGPNAGTVHGRLALLGTDNGGISRTQWETAEWYIGKHNAYLRAIHAPRDAVGPVPGRTVADDDEAYAAFCREARSTWNSIQKLLTFKDRHGGNIFGRALDMILIRQHNAPGLVGDLRLALNEIGNAFLSNKGEK